MATFGDAVKAAEGLLDQAVAAESAGDVEAAYLASAKAMDVLVAARATLQPRVDAAELQKTIDAANGKAAS